MRERRREAGGGAGGDESASFNEATSPSIAYSALWRIVLYSADCTILYVTQYSISILLGLPTAAVSVVITGFSR